ncbi:MAG: hypothetical protein MJ219_00525 [Mycoplasmoidaceae bacterium]|nr:hypothetical protein [Mycoplasmoidaceae bacterium]
MFAYCSSLTEVPGLPATTLAEGCYMYMFAYCSSLTEVPDLPAPTLAERCYKNMFFYCSALKIKQQDTKIEDEGFIFTCPNEYPEGAVSGMFNYISSESEFKGNPQPGKSYY